jgi:hypothetical protein
MFCCLLSLGIPQYMASQPAASSAREMKDYKATDNFQVDEYKQDLHIAGPSITLSLFLE